jgi:hypothetical protein
MLSEAFFSSPVKPGASYFSARDTNKGFSPSEKNSPLLYGVSCINLSILTKIAFVKTPKIFYQD